MVKRLLLLAFLGCFTQASLSGQEDNILWAQIQLRKQIDENWSVQAQPIFRLNDDLGSYQNSSIDYSVRRKIGKGFYLNVTGRTWFIPSGGGDRQFLWIDVGHTEALESLKINMTNRIRFHHAFDIKGRPDADFIRYMFQLVPMGNAKFKPTIGIEPWFRRDGINKIGRWRFEPGFRYAISPSTGLTVVWRRQEEVLEGMDFGDNLWVVALVHKL